MMTAPLMAICQNVDTPTSTRPSLRNPITKAPMSTPRTFPRPPVRAAPPMTTAAMALSSKVSPSCGAALVSSDEMMSPVVAAQKPLIR